MDLQAAQTSIILFQAKREITGLWKRFFIILEDLRDANKITLTEYSSFRKKILDEGNGSIRALEEQVKQFDNHFGQGNQQEQGTNDSTQH